jgi:hypothetical protein
MPRLILLTALAISVVTNAWLFFLWRDVESPRKSATATTRPRLAVTTATAATAPLPLLTSPANETEFATLRVQLESLGLPPEFVRAALMTTLHRIFRKKRDEVMKASDPNEYWRIPYRWPDDAIAQAALREHEREWKRKKSELVGDDFDDDPDSQIRQYGNLPPEKVARLRKILADYADLEEQIYAGNSDRGSPENRALAREKRADLERLLTPEELLGYDLRNSPASHRLRDRFGNLEATEAEFLALYPTFKAVTEENTAPGFSSRSNQEKRLAHETAERRLDAELVRVLGEARFAELKDANDHLLRETRAFTASLNLPPNTAADVIAIQKEFGPKLNAIDRNRDLTANQRDAQASALGSEARDRLIRMLGPENLETYKRRGGGWLGAALNRRPSTPTLPP